MRKTSEKDMNNNKTATAIHEAAHFVIQRHYLPNFPSYRITVVPDGVIAGKVMGESAYFEGSLGDLANEVVVLFAGFHAEVKAFPDELEIARVGASADDEDAEKIIVGCGFNEDSLRERAAKLVDQHWQEIMALSRFLLAKQELSGEVAEVFCDTFLSRNPIGKMFLHFNPVLNGAKEYFD